MSYLIGVLIMVAALLASVALHEVGHMVPAKRFGVLVPEYSIGFGPLLAHWRGRRRADGRGGDTQYSIRAIPLGGYVRITGMYGPARPGTRTTRAKDGRPTLAQEAREASLEEIPAGQESRAFYLLSAPRKIVVMLGGPFMNLMISAAVMAIALFGIGVQQATTTLDAVPETVTGPAGASVPGPAFAAGIKPGETIVSLDGRPVDTWEDLVTDISESAGTRLTLGIESVDGSTTRTVTLEPVVNDEGRYITGVTSRIESRPATPAQYGESMWYLTSETAKVVTRLPVAVWDVAKSLFTDQERDSGGVVSVVGVGRMAGEIASGDGVGGHAATFRDQVALFLSLIASLNMALFVFNLIPLPPLDGGHIAGALYEGLRRTWARLRNRLAGTPTGSAGARPLPGYADTAKLVPITWTVIGLFAIMTVILVAADIFEPIKLS